MADPHQLLAPLIEPPLSAVLLPQAPWWAVPYPVMWLGGLVLLLGLALAVTGRLWRRRAPERALPNIGLACFADPAGGPARWLDTGRATVRAAHAGAFAERQAQINEAFARCGVRHLHIGTEVDDLLTVMHAHG